MGRLGKLAVDSGSDVALLRMQVHINAAFLSLMPQLEKTYAEKGHVPLPKEVPEVEKIDLLAPRALGPLCGL